jgi:hypothetical protein
MSVRPRIPVLCDCGTRGEGEAGEAWRCAACGRLFRLPAAPEQLAALAQARRDYAKIAWLTLAVALSAALTIAWASEALTGTEVVPIALTVWAGAVVPLLGRRRKAASSRVQALLLR